MTGPLQFVSIEEAGRAFRSREISPLELTRALLARIERLDPGLNVFIHCDAEGALAAAEAAGNELANGRDRGPLHGIPVGIKDIIDVAGVPTTCHSKIFSARPPVTRDAAVTARLRGAGAVILGKLATHEFAIGGPSFDLPFPPARNPWNRHHHPGGSSSGSGAGVAAGFFPAALGTDTGGSVRNPASSCGIVGLKPTYGLVSRRGVRIGFVRHFHEQDLPADSEMAAALEEAARVLASEGALVRTTRLPGLNEFRAVNRVIMSAEAWAIHAGWLRTRPGDYGALARRRLLIGAFLSAGDYVQAMQRRLEMIAAVNEVFRDVDALLTASNLDPPCRIDQPEEIARTYPRQARTPFNVTGHPALAMMAGLSQAGLPLSLQFVARHFEEATLYRIAAAYERATPWHTRHPPLA